jgi:hypothetical protein
MLEKWGFLIEAGLFGGVALGWAFWQLYSVRKEIRKDRETAAAKEKAEGGAG